MDKPEWKTYFEGADNGWAKIRIEGSSIKRSIRLFIEPGARPIVSHPLTPAQAREIAAALLKAAGDAQAEGE